jgi:hypothetical protein
MMSSRIALWGSSVVSVMVVVGAILLSGMLFQYEIPEKNREIAIGLLGGFGPLVGIVVKAWMDLLVHIYNSPTTVLSQQSGSQEVKQ